MFPIALSVAETQRIEARGLFIAITLVASMSLITPIGYQTNLMVYGPDNYRFTYFFKVGFLLELTLWALVIILGTHLLADVMYLFLNPNFSVKPKIKRSTEVTLYFGYLSNGVTRVSI